ncbi:MAG: hypothetical protein IPN71_06340 [Fibrobacteres bacterium]|nr:hypothetical protein [Fibrobacterota bacterium]
MPLRKPRKPNRVARVVALALLLGFLYFAISTANRVLPIKGWIAFGALFVVCGYGIARSIRKSKERLIAQRGDPSIEKFIKPLDARRYDPVVVRAVYEILSKRCHPVQVLPDDDLVKTFFGDDLELVEIAIEFEQWFEVDLESPNSVPDRQVRTARDLIVYFEELLRAKEKSAT